MQTLDFGTPAGTVQFRLNASGNRVLRILLPGRAEVRGEIRPTAETTIRVSGAVQRLITALQLCLRGEAVTFSLEALDLDRLSPFQRQVLSAVQDIPRGRVKTYGQIAAAIGRPGAARAVGRALAANPFPIVIPCHRVIRCDGELGGFTGGVSLKHRLLDLEQMP
jgi:methylated-DNA-[protein]-cysteine S-methyltransferase